MTHIDTRTLVTHRARRGLILLLPFMAGCAPKEIFSYDEGLRQARRKDRDLVVFYKDPMDERSGQVRDALKSAEVAPLLSEKVFCTLVPFYSPNRKFVTQYGVQAPPGIIVVHPDTTYHTLNGVHSADEIRSFLESAKPPGQQPNVNTRLPSAGKFEYFNIYEQAVEKSRRQNRRLVIICKWWLDPNSTELIRRMIRPDVARYFDDSVNCILDWDHTPNRETVRPYGVTTYPAIIIVEPDGQYRVLDGLASVDQIIRFALSGQSPTAP